MSGLPSGQVADAAGVNLQTLRCYERRGLLAEPEHRPRHLTEERHLIAGPWVGALVRL